MPGRCRTRSVALVLGAAMAGAAPAPAAVQAPVGITRAQTAALAKAPGTLIDTTLALDRGRLVYGVEIASAADTRTRVEVDAGSGRVLRVTSQRERGPFPRELEAP